MPTFLVELYLPRRCSVEEVAERARRAADVAAESTGSGIRYVRATHIADEETCFVTFEAPSREPVVVAALVAGWERALVIEAIEAGDGTRRAAPRTPSGSEGTGKA